MESDEEFRKRILMEIRACLREFVAIASGKELDAYGYMIGLKRRVAQQ